MATFIQLTNFKSSEEKEIEYFNHDNKYVVKNQDVFSKIPGSPIVYWVNNKIRNIFYENAKISASAYLKQGLATSDNKKFLRLWYEVDLFNIGFYFSNRNDANKSGMRWFPLNKGGGFRKWFGNNEYVINWMYDGKEIKKAVAEK